MQITGDDRRSGIPPLRDFSAEVFDEIFRPERFARPRVEAEKLAGGKPGSIKTTDRIVALVEYRDGTVIDVVRQVIDK